MKNIRLIFGLTTLIILLGLQPVSAKEAPTSAEQLRSEIEAAIKAKNPAAFLALINWQGVPTDTNSRVSKQEVSETMTFAAKQEVASVKLIPLSDDFHLTNELDGVRYRPNVEVVGLVQIESPQKGNYMQMPYGKSGGAYYLAGTVEEKLPGPFTKAKMLAITIMGTADHGTFTGSFVFVRNGKEIKESIVERGSSFYGDYIKSCTIQKTTSSEDSIQLSIMENGKNIFESEAVTNKTPIVYEKK